MVDEAHGTGCIGPGGRGALAAAGVKADVIVGTLGKALGSYGAYAACSHELRELLINRARPFIFATAPGPPSVGAARAALAVVRSEPQLVERLQANAVVLREALRDAGLVADSPTQIMPLVVGEPEAAVAAAARAFRRCRNMKNSVAATSAWKYSVVPPLRLRVEQHAQCSLVER